MLRMCRLSAGYATFSRSEARVIEPHWMIATK